MTLEQTVKWSLFLFFATAVANAADSSKRITWDEFSMRVTPKNTIQLVLPDGTRIEGAPLQVKPDAVGVRITRSSNEQAHPKGPATIPRESVAVVQIRNPRQLAKVAGTIAPIAVGALAAVAGAFGGDGSGEVLGNIAPGIAIGGIGGTLGFFVGRSIDNRFEQLIIIPERQSAKPIP